MVAVRIQHTLVYSTFMCLCCVHDSSVEFTIFVYKWFHGVSIVDSSVLPTARDPDQGVAHTNRSCVTLCAGIQYSHIQFTDNTLCLELIEKAPMCVIKLLDEECKIPKGSDEGYCVPVHGRQRVQIEDCHKCVTWSPMLMRCSACIVSATSDVQIDPHGVPHGMMS